MKNFYDGVVEADEDGCATVTLPAWFAAVNRDFRYQLTPIGGPAPELHVAQEFADGAFRLAGARPGMRVCWQLTGSRCDAWAKANALKVEERKLSAERGHYLHPGLQNPPSTQGIAERRHPRSTASNT